MKTVIRNGRIVDPSQGIDKVCDLVIDDGKIKEVKSQRSKVRSQRHEKNKETREIDATGKLVLPGLIDLHVHLREPGY